MFNISNLPIELTKKIFCECLDEETQLKCFDISKRINWLVSTHLLSNLQIPVSDNPTPYSQLMKYYKKHCNYFDMKLPTSFLSPFWKTISQAKLNVSDVMSKSGPFNNTILDEAWARCMHQIKPVQNSFLSIDIRPESDVKYNDTLASNPNEDVQMFIRAGVHRSRLHPDTFGAIINQDWCTKETVTLLLKYNFRVTTNVILGAIDKKFNEILPDLLNAVKEENLSLYDFCKNANPDYESLVEKCYVDRVSRVSAYEIRGALESGYSEKFISKLLTKCNKGIDSYHVRLALEAKHSEGLVLDILRKSCEGLNKHHVWDAMDGEYSSHLIEVLVDKLCEGEQFTYNYVKAAVEKKYPQDIISMLLEKISESELKYTLSFFIDEKLYQNLVEQYLPKLKENFDYTIMRDIINNDYPEEFFLKILDKTTIQSLAVNQVYLSDVISRYSAGTVELLLDKGIKVYIDDVSKALEKKLSEKVLSRIIEKVEYVELTDIKTARRLSYSPELIKQMQAKCSSSECAIA